MGVVWFGTYNQYFWDNHHPDLMVHHPFPPIGKTNQEKTNQEKTNQEKKATTDQKPSSPSCVGGDGELRSPLIF
jgi:hypothetical protein